MVKPIIGHYSNIKLNNVFLRLRVVINAKKHAPAAVNLIAEIKKGLDLLDKDLDILVKSLKLDLYY